MTWQPIETAPDDGTAIWLLCDGVPYIGYGEHSLFGDGVRWTAKAGFTRREGCDAVYSTMFEAKPTAWQALPEPTEPAS